MFEVCVYLETQSSEPITPVERKMFIGKVEDSRWNPQDILRLTVSSIQNWRIQGPSYRTSIYELKNVAQKEIWEELIVSFPLIRHGPHKKRKTSGGTRQCKIWDGLRCRDIHTNFHKDWFRLSNLIGRIHTDTPSNIKVLSQKFHGLQCRYYWWEEFMMYAVGMASCGMIYVPSLMKFGLGTQKLIDTDTHRQQGDLISLLLFFLNKESRLKEL
jgi:hypothetical protein